MAITTSHADSTGRPDAAFGVALGCFAVLVWSATPAAFAFANQGFDPLLSGALRTVLAVPIAVLALLLLAGRGVRMPFDREGVGLLAVAGIGGFAVYPLVFSVGIDMTSTGHVGLILAILPVQTAGLAFVMQRQMPGRSWLIGVAVAVAGEAVLFLGTEVDPNSSATLAGDFVVLGSTVFAAAGYLAGARLGARMGFVGGAFACILTGGVCLLPLIVALAPSVDPGAVPAVALGGLGYLCVMSVILGYMAWYAGLAKGGVHRVAPLQFVQPLLTVALGVILFAETVGATTAIAAVLILSGVWLTRRPATTDRGERE